MPAGAHIDVARLELLVRHEPFASGLGQRVLEHCEFSRSSQ